MRDGADEDRARERFLEGLGDEVTREVRKERRDVGRDRGPDGSGTGGECRHQLLFQ